MEWDGMGWDGMAIINSTKRNSNPGRAQRTVEPVLFPIEEGIIAPRKSNPLSTKVAQYLSPVEAIAKL